MTQTGLLESERGKTPEKIEESVTTSGGDDTFPCATRRKKLCTLQNCEPLIYYLAKVTFLVAIENRETRLEEGFGDFSVDDGN